MKVLDKIRFEVNNNGTWQTLTNNVVNVECTRAEGELGTVAVDILDDSLDPVNNPLLRPSRQVRLRVLSGGAWFGFYAGEIDTVDVEYIPTGKAGRRAQVRVNAVDAVSKLSGMPENRGVGNVNDLRWLLNGRGVAFVINGNTAPLTTGTIVSQSDSTSLWDQIGLTRDSNTGHAWIDRLGRVNVYDNLTTTPTASIGPSDYQSLTPDFSMESIINSVVVEWQRYNVGTEQSVGVPYAPITDAASIAEWGERQVTVAAQGPVESQAAVDAIANDILIRNSTAQTKVKTTTVVLDESRLHLAIVDINDHINVTLTDGSTTQTLRITGIKHSITGDRWNLEWTFEPTQSIAKPALKPMNTTSLIPEGAVSRDELATEVNVSIDDAHTNIDNLWEDSTSQWEYAGFVEGLAHEAQASADGKNTVYYSTTAPTGGTYKVNDLWFDTDDGYRIYRWSGSAWSATQFGTNAISDAAVTTAKIPTGAVIRDRIANAAVDTTKITNAAITNALIADAAVANAQIANAAISTAKIADAAIVSAKIGDAQITNAKIANLDAAKITTGYLDAGRIAANTITTGQLRLTDINNYSQDPRMVDIGAWVSTTFYYASVEGPSPEGTERVMRVTKTNDGSSRNFQQVERVPVSRLDTLLLKCYVRHQTTVPTTGSVRLYLQFFDKTDAYISTFTPSGCSMSAVTLSNSGFKLLKGKVLPANIPSNATTARIVAQVDGGVDAGLYDFTDVDLYKAISGDLLVQGAIDGQTITGAVVKTAASGRRIVLNGLGLENQIEFYAHSTSTYVPATISPADASSPYPGVVIASGYTSGSSTQAEIYVKSEPNSLIDLYSDLVYAGENAASVLSARGFINAHKDITSDANVYAELDIISSSGMVQAKTGLRNMAWENGGGTAANINNGGYVVRGASSERYKKYITTLDPNVAMKALDLRPVRYQYRADMDMGDCWYPGFIAEEAHAAGMEMWVTYDRDGNPDGFRYAELTAAHNVIIKAQQTRIDALETRLAALEAA